MKPLFLLVVLLLLVSACTTFPTSSGRAVRELTEEDNDRIVEMQPGEMLAVRLKSNPTTGYQWYVNSVDADVLGMVSEADYEADDKTGMLIGSGGVEEWRFEALKPGTTTLQMAYRFSEDEERETAETFEIQVIVQ